MLIIQILDLFKMNLSQFGLVCMHTKYATYFCSAALNNEKKTRMVIWWPPGPRLLVADCSGERGKKKFKR